MPVITPTKNSQFKPTPAHEPLLLGAQYYRPPTPRSDDWAADFKRMKQAGLDTVQLWAVWGWLEPSEGTFVYDDYDRLVELADQHRMKVVISTITDLQPFWMPRAYPHTVMLDEFGQPVRGTPREECLPGLTPGQCTDHPEVRALSERFMRELAAHYREAPALAGWDCWNETRWSCCSERWVCYCPATINAFRLYLRSRYGSLETLSEAWGQRLTDWEDVMPARSRSFLVPSVLDWFRFMTHRSHEMGIWRRDALRSGDPDHLIVAHSGGPVTHNRAWSEEVPFSRGNDFDTGPEMDAFGTSAFPAWSGFDNALLGIWLEVTRSVAHPKPMWESEMQGGAFNQGFRYGEAVTGAQQQYWTWQAYSRGAKAVLYWSWRDEVWGVESGGFGIDGQDGFAEDRKQGLLQTRCLLDAHAEDLNGYTPDPAQIGILYDSDSALIALATRERSSHAVTRSVNGCMEALERQRLPFDLLDGRRLVIPPDIKLLLLPAALCLKADAADAILKFLKAGGWVFCEAGTAIFRENGFFVDRPEKRALVGKLGIGALRRRGAHVDASCDVPAGTWAGSPMIKLGGSALWSVALDAPEGARVLARDAAGDALLIDVSVGRGKLVMSGAFPAHAYNEKAYEGFEQLIWSLASNAGALPSWTVEATPRLDGLAVRTGLSGSKRLFFLLNAGCAKTVILHPDALASGPVHEWVQDTELPRQKDGSLKIELDAPCQRILDWTISKGASQEI